MIGQISMIIVILMMITICICSMAQNIEMMAQMISIQTQMVTVQRMTKTGTMTMMVFLITMIQMTATAEYKTQMPQILSIVATQLMTGIFQMVLKMINYIHSQSSMRCIGIKHGCLIHLLQIMVSYWITMDSILLLHLLVDKYQKYIGMLYKNGAHIMEVISMTQISMEIR